MISGTLLLLSHTVLQADKLIQWTLVLSLKSYFPDMALKLLYNRDFTEFRNSSNCVISFVVNAELFMLSKNMNLDLCDLVFRRRWSICVALLICRSAGSTRI